MRKLGQKRDMTKAGALADMKLHAYVATPAYDGRVYTDYCISLAETCQVTTAYGINVTAGVMGNGAFIDLARNTFVRMFLESKATQLFFIDADLKFEPRAVIGLLQANLPICAGVYRRREEREDYPVRYVPGPEGGLQVEGGWIKCDRVPTGFLCIRRDVVEQMAEKADKIEVTHNGILPRLFYTFIDDEQHFIGEDFAFCDDYCRMFDASIPVWPDFDFVHAGYECNYHKFLTKLAEAEEAGAVVEKGHFETTVDGEVLRDGTRG
jgi:hypothetical protein